MRIPFAKVLNDVFKNDRLILAKMAGGALVGALVSGRVVASHDRPKGLNGELAIAMVAVATAIGALVALSLSLKDAVQSRNAAGQSVSLILQIYFGMGIWSLLVWIVTSVVLVILFTALDVAMVA